MPRGALEANSEERPWIQAPTAPATSESFVWASRVPAIPERTSPLPAAASTGVPAALTRLSPFGDETIVGTPLSSTVAPKRFESSAPISHRRLCNPSPFVHERRAEY